MDGHQAPAERQAPHRIPLTGRLTVATTSDQHNQRVEGRHPRESAHSGPCVFRTSERTRPRAQANACDADPVLDQRTGTAMTVKSASNMKPSSSSSKCAVHVTAGPEPGGPLPHAFASETGSMLPSGAV